MSSLIRAWAGQESIKELWSSVCVWTARSSAHALNTQVRHYFVLLYWPAWRKDKGQDIKAWAALYTVMLLLQLMYPPRKRTLLLSFPCVNSNADPGNHFTVAILIWGSNYMHLTDFWGHASVVCYEASSLFRGCQMPNRGGQLAARHALQMTVTCMMKSAEHFPFGRRDGGRKSYASPVYMHSGMAVLLFSRADFHPAQVPRWLTVLSKLHRRPLK